MLDKKGCKHLAVSVVRFAVTDYFKALKDLQKNPDNIIALDTKAEIEEFFKSSWYQTLRGFAEDLIPQNMMEILNNDKI